MKLKLNISLFFLLTFAMPTVFAMTFTTTQSGGNSSKDLTVQAGKHYQLKFDLQHQTTSAVRVQIIEGTNVIVDASNLIDGSHVYSFAPTTNLVTLKFIREDNDNLTRDFEVDNLTYEEITSILQTQSNHVVGRKGYELNDHLGNVRAVVSDKKVNGNSEIISATDYLPFGMIARSYTNGDYRYGYGGHDKINEISGEGNSIDMGFRFLDVRIARSSSMDNYCAKYPGTSPYAYALNTPLSAVDPDGNLIVFIGGLRLWQNDADQAGSGDADQKGAFPGIYSLDVFVDENGEGYWHKCSNTFGQDADLAGAFMERTGDYNVCYTSGSSRWTSQAETRQEEGKLKAQEFHCMVQEGQIKLEAGESIKIVCHSQGGAHSIGFAEQLMTYKNADGSPLYNIEVIYMVTPHQPTDIDLSQLVGKFPIKQYSHPSDAVSSSSWILNGGSKFGVIPGVTEFDQTDILNKNTAPKGTGLTGNWNGHAACDNMFIFNIEEGKPGYVAPRLDNPQTYCGGAAPEYVTPEHSAPEITIE